MCVCVFTVLKSCYYDDSLELEDSSDSSTAIERTQTFNDTIQYWIDNNVPNVDSVSIEEMGSFDVDIQQRVFYLMTPNSKKKIWQERMEAAKEHLSSSQVGFLEVLESVLVEADFTDTLLNEDVASDLHSWKDDALEYHNWDTIQVIQLLKTFTPLNEPPTFFAMAGPVTSIDDSDKWCNCRLNLYCRTLTLNKRNCVDKNCRRIPHCGILMGTQDCTGRCHRN